MFLENHRFYFNNGHYPEIVHRTEFLSALTTGKKQLSGHPPTMISLRAFSLRYNASQRCDSKVTDEN